MSTAFVAAQARQIVIAEGDTVDFMTIVNKKLPVLDISTVDHEEPTCDYVSAPAGCWGKSITNATKVPGRLRIFKGSDEPAYDTGEYDDGMGGMTVKLRGNTSAYRAKKPYKIKLTDAADLIQCNRGVMKDKEWVLLVDDSQRAFSGLTLGRMMGMKWTPRFQYVNLVFNDEYRGVYLLIESVKRNTDCRINVSKQGYIIEADAYWWNEDFAIRSTISSPYGFTFKYPKEFSDGQVEFIQQYLKEYEASLFKSNYTDYIDIESFARWCLIQDIFGVYDSGGTNRFMSKYDQNPSSLLEMPCLWDFDSMESYTTGWSRCHTEHFYMLFNNSNRQFLYEYIWQWIRVCDTLAEQMQDELTAFYHSQDGTGLSNSYPLDNRRWNRTVYFSSNISSRKKWYLNRLPNLDALITSLMIPGDANIDGKVDVLDINHVINAVMGKDVGGIKRTCDINGDKRIDVADVNSLVNLLLNN